MKHSYQTRRLLALRDMRHDGQNVVAGSEVFATQTDANYLIRAGHARDLEAPLQVSAPAATPAPAPTPIAAPTRRGPGRPPRAVAAAPEQAPAETGSADELKQDTSDASDGASGANDPGLDSAG